MSYDMEDFLKQCVERYQEIGGPIAQKLKKVPAPYIDEHLEPSDLVEPESATSPLKPEPRGNWPRWLCASS